MARSKGIGLGAATAVGLGAIIGAGIFVLSGTAIALAGVYAFASFLLVGITAFIIAYELGELGSIMPRLKGAAYSYAYQAFGSQLGFITGILQYMSFSVAIGAIALGFGAYMSSLLGVGSAEYAIPFAIAAIFVLAVVNIVGVKKAAEADLGLVLVKLGILSIFIVAAVLIAMHGGVKLTNFTSGSSRSIIGGIFAASVAVFFAYSGFQAISTILPDIKGGAKKASKAILYSVLISMVFYILVVFAMMLLVPASMYTVSADPLSFALAYSHAPKSLFYLVDIGALIATASATLAMILSSSRVLYQMSTDGLMPAIFRKYNASRDVAVNGVIASSVIGVLVLFAGNVYVIAALSNFGLMFSYLLVSFAVIHYRRRKKNAQVRTPAYPYLTVIAIILLLAFIFGMPRSALEIGVVVIFLLIVIYYFLSEYDEKRISRIRLFK